MNQFELHLGDCLETLRTMPDNSVDSIVTDPPYGLTANKKGGTGVASVNLDSPYGRARIGTGNGAGGFMGLKWDGDVPSVEIWAECLRVLKPGGHLLAFAGTRTQHRMAVRIEDAGFEIRDMIAWVYSTGFPKSHNIDNHRGEKVCGCALPYTHAKTKPDTGATSRERAGMGIENGEKAECSLRSLRDSDVPPAKFAGEELGQVLQQGVPEQGASTTGWAQLSAAEDGSEQPGLERRSDASQAARELCSGTLHTGATVGGNDGQGGWVCDGAPSGDGAVVRLPADADGVRTPHGSRSPEQHAVEPGIVAGQSKPQAVGAWPVCRGCGLPVLPRGLGTALKPALEPITVARKPLIGTVAENVLAHGTGALNIDGCRVEGESTRRTNTAEMGFHGGNLASEYQTGSDAGRWPANLVHDGSEEVVTGFPVTGPSSGAQRVNRASKSIGTFGTSDRVTAGVADAGGSAARFFKQVSHDDEDLATAQRFMYCAKASKRDRDEGLERFEAKARNGEDYRRKVNTSTGRERGDVPRANTHPTVKPTDLMAYLVRLVTPPGGTVLDPFMGSGSTGKAAMREGLRFVGIEREAEYLAIARARIAAAAGDVNARVPVNASQIGLFT